MPSASSPSAPEAEAALSGAVELACATVSGHVAAGRWPGGYTLVEADLMLELGVSRSTVREALRRLESEGLVVKKRSRTLAVRRLTRRDVEELYDLREVLEGHAAGRAALYFARQDAATRRAFKDEAQWWAEAARRGSGEALSQANAAFHNTILSLSGNSHLPRLLGGTLMTLFVSQFRPRLSPESGLVAARHHVGIARAIMEGDVASAESLMRAHVRNSAGLIQSLADDAFGQAAPAPAGTSHA